MILTKTLKSHGYARKIFGKKEIIIIDKQVKGIPLSQSERNRLSRDIRPKFEFIKDISVFKNEFKLKKFQESQKIIEKTVETLLKDKLSNNIKAILLFGSYADNTQTIFSDIDICAIFDKKLSLKEITLFRIRTLGNTYDNVDIQVFDNLPQRIQQEIKKNHKIMYENPRNKGDRTIFD